MNEAKRPARQKFQGKLLKSVTGEVSCVKVVTHLNLNSLVAFEQIKRASHSQQNHILENLAVT